MANNNQDTLQQQPPQDDGGDVRINRKRDKMLAGQIPNTMDAPAPDQPQQSLPKPPKMGKGGKGGGGDWYQVQDGDSYFGIAGQKFGNQRMGAIISGINKGQPLKAGDWIRLPGYRMKNEDIKISAGQMDYWNNQYPGQQRGTFGGTQGGDFWTDPQKVARFYHFVNSQPAGWQAPDWLDTNTLNEVYGYYQSKYQGQAWNTWKSDYNDPVNGTLKGLPTPPDDFLLGLEKFQYGTTAQTKTTNAPAQTAAPAEPQPGDPNFDWSKYPPAFKVAFDMMSNPLTSAAVTTGPMAVMALSKGNIFGAGAAVAAAGAGAISNFANQEEVAKYQAKEISLGELWKRDNLAAYQVITERIMGLLNKPAEAMEQAQGFYTQAREVQRNEGWQALADMVKDPAQRKAAWEAGKIFYESQAAEDPLLGNLAMAAFTWIAARQDEAEGKGKQYSAIESFLGKPVIDAVMGVDYAKKGEIWAMPGFSPENQWSATPVKLEGGDTPQPVTLFGAMGRMVKDFILTPTLSNFFGSGPVGAAADRADETIMGNLRRDIAKGDLPASFVIEVYRQKFGFGGAANDMAAQMIYDPLNVVDSIESGVIKGVADSRLTAMLAKFDNIPDVKALRDAGNIDGAIAAIAKIDAKAANDMKTVRGLSAAAATSEGVVGTGKTFADMTKTGATGKVAGVDSFNWFERMAAGLDEQGRVKAWAAPDPNATGWQKAKQFFFDQAPENRAASWMSALADNMGVMVDATGRDPDSLLRAIGALASNDMQTARDLAGKLVDSPEMYTSLPMMREYTAKAREWQALRASVFSESGVGTLLDRLAAVLGEDGYEILRKFKTDEDTALLFERVRQAAASGTSAESALIKAAIDAGQLTPETLRKQFSLFVKDNIPYHADEWTGRILDDFYSHSAEWMGKYFNIKPESGFYTFAHAVKNVQSLLLLGFNPAYLINNALNNAVTLAANGTFGFVPEWRAKEFFDRFGVTPNRMGEGAGITGDVLNTGSGAGQAKLSDAARNTGWAGKFNKMTGDLSKLGPASGLSSKVEAISSRTAFVTAMKKTWGGMWKRGKGFSQMPANLSAMLGRISPDLPAQVYSAIEGGMNWREIETKFTQGFDRAEMVSEYIDRAAKKSGMTSEEARDMLDTLGLTDVLKEKLSKAKTAEDVRKAFTSIQRQAEDRIDLQAAQDLRNRAEHTRNKIKAGGAPEVVSVFHEVERQKWQTWMDSQEVMAKFFDESPMLTAEAADVFWATSRAQNNRAWQRMQDYEASVIKGVVEGLGFTTDEAVNVQGFFLRERDIWRDAFSATDSFYADAKAGRMTWDQARAQADTTFKSAFDQAESTRRRMGETVSAMIAKSYGDDIGAKARAHFAGVADTMSAMSQKIREIYALKKDMKPEQWRKMFKERRDKEYNPLIAKYLEAERDAAVKVYGPGEAPEQILKTAEIDAKKSAVMEAARRAGVQIVDETGQPIPSVEKQVIATVRTYGGPDGRSVRRIEDITPEMADAAYQARAEFTRMQEQEFERSRQRYEAAQAAAAERARQINAEMDQTAQPVIDLTPEQTKQAALRDSFVADGFGQWAQDNPTLAEPMRNIFTEFLREAEGASTETRPDLLTRLRKGAGIKLTDKADISPDVKAVGVFKSNGLPIDQVLREILEDEGYVARDTIDINAARDMIRRALDGEKIYPMGYEPMPEWIKAAGGQDNAAMLVKQILAGAEDATKARVQKIKDAAFSRLFDVADGYPEARQYLGLPFDAEPFQRDMDNFYRRMSETNSAAEAEALMTEFMGLLERLPNDADAATKQAASNLYDQIAANAQRMSDTESAQRAAADAERMMTDAEGRAFAIATREDVRNQMVEAFEMDEAEADAIMAVMDARAEVWAKATGGNPGDWYGEKIAGVQRGRDGQFYQNADPEGGIKRGAVTFQQDGRAIVTAMQSPNVSTFLHETGHIFRRDLYDTAMRTADPQMWADIEEVEKWAGVERTDDNEPQWTREAEEKFARGFEEYLAEGRAPTSALEKVFNLVKDWMRRIYTQIAGSQIDTGLTDEMRAVFGRLLAEPEAAQTYNSSVQSFSTLDEFSRGLTVTKDKKGRFVVERIMDDRIKRTTVEAATSSADAIQRLYESEKKVFEQYANKTSSGFMAKMQDDMQSISQSAPQPSRFVSWTDAKPGDEISSGMFLVERNIKTKSAAQKLAEATGGSVAIDGPRTWAVVSEKPAGSDTFFQADEPSGYMVPGGYDQAAGYAPMSEMLADGYRDHLRPFLEGMREEVTGDINTPRGFSMGNLDPQSRAELERYLKTVKAEMSGAKLATTRHAETMRDDALLNYGRRTPFGKMVDVVYPYRFWQTESMVKWAGRLIDKPQWLARYARIRQAQDRFEKNVPSRLKGKFRQPVPFMPDWAGGGIYFDPLKQLFPFTQLYGSTVLERMGQNASQQDQEAQRIINEWQQQGRITAEQGKQAVTSKDNTAWRDAMAEAQKRRESEISNPADFVSAVFGPAMYLTVPYYLATGQPEKIGSLPITRNMAAIETALQGTPLEFMGNMAGQVADIERNARENAGISEFGEWGDYYVDRQMANMAAEGLYSADEVQTAMIERQGEIYDQAIERVRYEMMTRTPGALALQGVGQMFGGKASLIDVINVLGPSLFPGSLLPEGELKYRGLKEEYSAAWETYRGGAEWADSVGKFFDDHPEYNTRLALYQEPEERLKNFLVSQVYDTYFGLDDYQRKQAREQMGDMFAAAFLDEETRSPESVDIQTLSFWARFLGGQVPQTEQTKSVTDIPDLQFPKAQVSPDFISKQVTKFYDERDNKYPDWRKLQSGYYDLPEKSAARRQYLLTHPQLKEYWDWKSTYYEQNPLVAAELKREYAPVDFKGWDPLLMKQLVGYSMWQESLSPNAYAALKKKWQAAGSPAGSVESWLDSRVVPSLTEPGQ